MAKFSASLTTEVMKHLLMLILAATFSGCSDQRQFADWAATVQVEVRNDSAEQVVVDLRAELFSPRTKNWPTIVWVGTQLDPGEAATANEGFVMDDPEYRISFAVLGGNTSQRAAFDGRYCLDGIDYTKVAESPLIRLVVELPPQPSQDPIAKMLCEDGREVPLVWQ